MDNVNVSVLLYVPVRSGSLALIDCLNAIATASLEVGPAHADLPSSTRSGSGSVNAPLVRWPGSLTDSVASPAVEVTVADVDAVYSFATPGVNGPNEAGAPSDNESVAGTVPPTVPSTEVAANSPGPTRNA